MITDSKTNAGAVDGIPLQAKAKGLPSLQSVNYPPINWQACNSALVDQLKY